MTDDNYLHEIVIPTQPLSVWIYLHNEYEANTYIAPHWHQGIELSFTVSGSIDDFVIAEKHYHTQIGTILVVNSQAVHSVYSRLKPHNKAISIIYPYHYVDRLYPAIEQEVIDLNQPENFTSIQKDVYIELQSILFKIYEILASNSKWRNLKLETLSAKVLQLLLEFFNRPKSEYDFANGTKEFEVARLQAITKFVSEKYAEKISLDDLAKQVNVSKQYLSKFFKKHLEMTVGQYINNFRAQKAYYDLLGKAGNLTQIAQRNGFSTTRAMNQALKILYGKPASFFYKRTKKD